MNTPDTDLASISTEDEDPWAEEHAAMDERRRALAAEQTAIAEEAGLRWRDWADAIDRLARQVPPRAAFNDPASEFAEQSHHLGVEHISTEYMVDDLTRLRGRADAISGAYLRAGRHFERLHNQYTEEG